MLQREGPESYNRSPRPPRPCLHQCQHSHPFHPFHRPLRRCRHSPFPRRCRPSRPCLLPASARRRRSPRLRSIHRVARRRSRPSNFPDTPPLGIPAPAATPPVASAPPFALAPPVVLPLKPRSRDATGGCGTRAARSAARRSAGFRVAVAGRIDGFLSARTNQKKPDCQRGVPKGGAAVAGCGSSAHGGSDSQQSEFNIDAWNAAASRFSVISDAETPESA